jgi:hypothetical protein
LSAVPAGPLLIGSGALVLAVAALVLVSLRLTGHRLVYPLDDAYIHMAVARNLAEHGVWGVTRHGFSSSTSSLLWPAMLAGSGALIGRGQAALPLLLNLIGAVLCLAVASWALSDRPARWRALLLLGLVFLTPLPTLVLVGMEHTLHVCAALLFLALVFRVLEGGRPPDAPGLALTAALATALRYESFFLVGAAGLVLAHERRGRQAMTVGLAALVAPVAYALVSLSQGWYLLPNSVLLKGARFDPTTPAGLIDLLGGRSLSMLWHTPAVLVLVLICLGLRLLAPRQPAVSGVQAIFVLTVLLHMQFADTGWLYRYEAYLVALGLLALGLSLPGGEGRPRALHGATSLAATVAMAAVIAYPLLERAVRALGETPRASKNIFDQQYQMGVFLRQFYPGAAVVANDIGAISYLADVRLLDLYGLASMEVARAHRAGGLSRETVTRLASQHRADVVLIYRSWFAQVLPRDWLEAGSWRAPEQAVVADRVVSFYALDPAGRDRLVKSLRAFQKEMPHDVVVRLQAAPDEP